MWSRYVPRYRSELLDHRDGSIIVNVRVNPRVVKNVNIGFRGRWHNAENIGKTEAEIIALWNAAYPEDLIVTESQPVPG